MLPHRMNLKGPWKYEWLSEQSETAVAFPTSGKIKMPQDWRSTFGEEPGRVRFSRVFHRPTNLNPQESVYIVMDGIGGASQISVNDVQLGIHSDSVENVSFEVTDLLRPTNELIVEVEFDPQSNDSVPGGLWAAVGIEIRSKT